MTKEDIEKAAIKNIEFQGKLDLASIIENSCRESFVLGANWRINSVWHDASEKPHRNKWYIAQIGDNAFDTFTDSVNWESYARGLNIIRWAYIEDLIPSK